MARKPQKNREAYTTWAFSNKNNKKRQILIENIKAKDKAYKEKEKKSRGWRERNKLSKKVIPGFDL